MKKFFYLFLIILVILIFGGYYVYRTTHLGNEGPRFASDERELETVIFQKDSENRGYSDIVKEKIDSTFLEPSIKNQMAKYAILERNLLRSKTSKDFISNHKKETIAKHCVSFLIKKYMTDHQNKIEIDEIVLDNEKMDRYYRYLSKIRFGNPENMKELVNWLNSGSSNVYTEQDFEKLCTK